ncbi:MAG: mobile mystery protein A [Gammaproteobacteria bacterium]|nr:mobile mystery protein A [Gammaproteobacteria bacterium]
MNFEHLMLKQLDEQLQDWTKIKTRQPPKKGWINLIRSALGLSSYQLAKKMGVNQSRVIQIETAENNRAITIKTLEKAAEAMNCKLIYGLVPNLSLQNILEEQARKIAKQQLARVSHSMGLEDQSISTDKQQQQYNELVKELLDSRPKKLWSNDE